jgi:hypothetical protein
MQVCGANKPGGAEAHFLRFCLEMEKREEVRIIVAVRKGSWLAKQLKKSSLTVYELQFLGRWDLLTRLRLRLIAQREQVQIAQCWMSRAASLMPRVDGTLNLGRLGGYYSLKNFTSMHWLVGATEDLAKHIRDHGQTAERTVVIPNFVNPPQPEDSDTSTRLRHQLQLKDKRVIFTPARLHPVKGLDTALKALSILPRDYVYILAGKGPEEANLRQQIAQLQLEDRVHLVGWTDNISQYCWVSDLFLVPSRHEPFGSVLLEAWSHQRPLISSDSQGATAITRHGHTALIFPKDDAAALSQAVMQLGEDVSLAQSLVQNGHKKYQQHYTADSVISAYISLYSKMLNT